MTTLTRETAKTISSEKALSEIQTEARVLAYDWLEKLFFQQHALSFLPALKEWYAEIEAEIAQTESQLTELKPALATAETEFFELVETVPQLEQNRHSGLAQRRGKMNRLGNESDRLSRQITVLGRHRINIQSIIEAIEAIEPPEMSLLFPGK